MQIIEFHKGTLRFTESIPTELGPDGFVWIFVERAQFEAQLPTLQHAAQTLGGSPLLELHRQDLKNDAHPSNYDYTSIYDLVIFRRLATASDAPAPAHKDGPRVPASERAPGSFSHISTRAVGFAVFDRLLISVHPEGCVMAKSFLERYLSDAIHSEGLSAAARSRLPFSPADLMLRMVNVMVDSYLDLRKVLSAQLEQWQSELLRPGSQFTNWSALMEARNEFHTLEDLCEEQQDAMQEWLDNLREQPLGHMAQADRDGLIARSRDVIEHIQRVVHHVRKLEQSAETVVQIHFSAQSHRTNDIMRTLTALTAVFLPLNLITGFFGMNFEFMPLLHDRDAFWWTFWTMVSIAVITGLVFVRKRYIARTSK